MTADGSLPVAVLLLMVLSSFTQAGGVPECIIEKNWKEF